MKWGLAVLVVLLPSALLAGASAQAGSRDARADRGTLLFVTPSGRLGRVNANGTGATILREVGRVSEPALSPDQKLLGDIEKGSLFVVDMDSGHRHLVARDVNSATWAPDSKRIAYSSGRWGDVSRQISVVRVDGSDRRRITHNTRATSGKYFDPYNELAWSPDGTRIAFLNWQNYSGHGPMNGGRLFTISPSGGREVPGPPLGKFDYPGARDNGWGFVPYTLSWSPDGRALAVASEAESGVLVVRGQRITWLRGSDCCVAPKYLAWSPDGRRLAFLWADTSAGHSGGVAALDGSLSSVLGSDNESSTHTPVWSPDSSRLAFLDCPWYAGPCRLYVSDRNGHHVTMVKTSAKIDGFIAWLR